MRRKKITKAIQVIIIFIIWMLAFGNAKAAADNCSTNLDCITHKAFVYSTICLYADACIIHVNSLWDNTGGDLYYGPGSNLANNILNSNPQGNMTFKELINLVVKLQIIDVFPDVKCVPIGNSQTLKIFSNSNEIASGYFDLLGNPGLFFAFGGFHIYPDGLNQAITLTRVNENDYKITGAIKIYLNDFFHYTDQEWTDQWAYGCQQAGCIHNFWTRVDINFTINDLELNLNSSQIPCNSKCCPDGCIELGTDDNCSDCGDACSEGKHCEGSVCLQDPTTVILASFTATLYEGYILVEWETASELDNAGFNIWRSESEDGEYVRINNELIEAKGDPTQGAEYNYTNTSAIPGITYYYMLEDIDTFGESTFHDPISAMIPISLPNNEYIIPYLQYPNNWPLFDSLPWWLYGSPFMDNQSFYSISPFYWRPVSNYWYPTSNILPLGILNEQRGNFRPFYNIPYILNPINTDNTNYNLLWTF